MYIPQFLVFMVGVMDFFMMILAYLLLLALLCHMIKALCEALYSVA